MIKKLVVLLGIILPWGLVVMFGLFGLEEKSYFFQKNAAYIIVSILAFVLVACVLGIIFSFNTEQKMFFKVLRIILFAAVFIATFFSMFLTLSLRNGIGGIG